MTLFLVDYIKQENSEIIKQHANLTRIEKALAEIESLFDKTDIELDELSVPITLDKTISNDTKLYKSKDKSSIDSHQIVSRSIDPFKLDEPIEQSSSYNSYRDNFERKSKSMLDDLHIYSLKNIPKKDSFKIEQYRKELLEQIQEKKRQKQLEEQRLKETEEELDRKISQQRFAMYLEYLDEQKKGDFIVKSKQMNNDCNVQDTISLDLEDSSTTNSNTNIAQKHTAKTNQNSNRKGYDENIALQRYESSESINKIKSNTKVEEQLNKDILANLNEVRKIMQNDHIEMLEKLLDLKIK